MVTNKQNSIDWGQSIWNSGFERYVVLIIILSKKIKLRLRLSFFHVAYTFLKFWTIDLFCLTSTFQVYVRLNQLLLFWKFLPQLTLMIDLRYNKWINWSSVVHTNKHMYHFWYFENVLNSNKYIAWWFTETIVYFATAHAHSN